MNEAVMANAEPASAAPQQRQGRVCGMIAEFESPGELIRACERVREAGYKLFDAHSPHPVHGIDRAIGIRMTVLPWIVMIGGVTGCATGLLLQWYTNAVNIRLLPTFLQGYNYLVSGKPYFSLPANIPVIFELTVLFSAITAVVAMLVLNNLPLFYNPIFRSERFRKATTDGYFISVDARDRKFDESATRELMDSLGSPHVETIVDFPSSSLPPAWIRATTAVIAFLLLIPPFVIWRAWNAKTDKPRIHLIRDMDAQDKYKSQVAAPLFADGRAMRPIEPGTVAVGELLEDDHYYRGLANGTFASTFPLHREEITLDVAFLQRGRERFNVYCAPCHGRDGSGGGMVAVRAAELGGGWVPPANLNDKQIRERPNGHLFNTITNGIRTMPPYGSRIPPADRWAIVAYVRALQRSNHALLEDVPPEHRSELR
ncbi:MAG: DUF3341 domain-containing protein [Planctomycetota bacterium]|nr:MAG: DUF3341 domain-containing protein [Planctomycetota bacterium]